MKEKKLIPHMRKQFRTFTNGYPDYEEVKCPGSLSSPYEEKPLDPEKILYKSYKFNKKQSEQDASEN